jgi:hypothetical protein
MTSSAGENSGENTTTNQAAATHQENDGIQQTLGHITHHQR